MSRRLTWAFIVMGCLGIGVGGVQATVITWNGTGAPHILSGAYGWEGDSDGIQTMGDILVDGTYTLSNELDVATYGYFPVVISQDTFISTSVVAPSSGKMYDYGHFIIYNKECCGTFFQVDNDLIFTGSNWVQGSLNNRELTVTFSGPGQTVFHIASGKMVGFEGFFGTGQGGWSSYMDDYNQTGSGTMVYVTMDQTYDDAVVKGVNKVVFERFYVSDGEDPGTDHNESVKISIGHNSFITYISTNDTGTLDWCAVGDIGHGAIAFDPMCYGAGRMLLHIKGTYLVGGAGQITAGTPNTYNDGALVVAGHYVANFTDPEEIRLRVKLNKPAGIEAICRIIDDQGVRDTDYYWNLGGGNDSTYLSEYDEPVLNPSPGSPLGFEGASSRRGLLVLNENKSIPAFAADPYVNNEWQREYIFKTAGRGTTSIRQGFVLGINGKMEVYHNTFLDYVAASTQMTRDQLYDQYSGTISTSITKKHNPSAFIADGLGILDIDNYIPYPGDPYSEPETLLYPNFVADAASYGGRHAQILLRGDARLYFRSGVSKDGYADVGNIDKNGMGGYWYGLDRQYSFTINYDATEGSYDGSFIAGLAADGGLWFETPGEGNNILDVEGKLTIRATPDDNRTNESGFSIFHRNIIPDEAIYPNYDSTSIPPVDGPCFTRHLPTYADVRGMLNVPPIKLDHMGQEIWNDMRDQAQRPLLVDRVYPCYNSSSIFLNNELAMHDVTWHHDDLLKIATPEPDKSEPAVVGGEKAVFDYAYWSALEDTGAARTLYLENPNEQINTKVPLISLFNTTLECHESIVVSGVRVVVTDKFWYDVDDAEGDAKLVPNTSRFLCYNHGDPLDMLKRGYGRTMMFGSQQNKMADGCLFNEYTQNAYINIYRGWNTDAGIGTWGNFGHLIQLSLETESQHRYVAQYDTRDNNPTGPNSFSLLIDWGTDQYKRTATQVIYLGNTSYSSVGWTTTWGDQVISTNDMADLVHVDGSYSYSHGINEGLRPRPWDAQWGLAARYEVDGDMVPVGDFRFSLTTRENAPAEMYINGDNYYFGGRDASGNLATEPVVASNESTIFYTNHGGKTYINQNDLSPDQQHYYDAFIDTIFAYRQWPRIWDAQTNSYVHGLSGIIDIPHDQNKFGRSIQPYALNMPNMYVVDDQTKERNVRVMVYEKDKYGNEPTRPLKASGEEVTIPWNFRTDKSIRIGDAGDRVFDTYEPSPTYTPVKAIPFMSEKAKEEVSRIFRTTTPAFWVGPNSGPAEMPETILTVSTGDIIAQMRVSGATKADPFHLYISGDQFGYGTVREFTSLTSNYFNPGEGAHAAIFLDGGAHIGLGQRDWNEHSKNAWSILGFDYVTIYPNGNSFIRLNNDVLIADKLPIIPTTNFGVVSYDRQSLTYDDEVQRITFHSEEPKEIRIMEDGELDLSAFGSPRLDKGFPFFEEEGETFWQNAAIEFSGKVRVVFEPGAKIRFPSSVRKLDQGSEGEDDEQYENFAQPILYFKGESELIFQASKDLDERNFEDYQGSDAIRNKIVGVGKIVIDENAKMKLFGLSFLGIETDDLTKTTSVTIEVKREGQIMIGSETSPGGSLQVGNPIDRGPDHSIDFKLILTDPESTLRIEREGFLGLGVGTINKFELPDFTWRFLGLYNTKLVDINVKAGVFDHSRIFHGFDFDTSALAIGPVDTFRFRTGTDGDFSNVFIQGGGNILFINGEGTIYPAVNFEENHDTEFFPEDAAAAPAIPFPTPNAAGGLYATGDYTIMSSSPMIKQRSATNVYAGRVDTVTVKTEFQGDPHAFYHFLGFPPLGYYGLAGEYIAFSRTQQKSFLGYVVGGAGIGVVGTNRVVRLEQIEIPENWREFESLAVGALFTELILNPDDATETIHGRLSKATKAS